MALWQQLETYTEHPLHRLKASELFLEVLALQDSGMEVDWPSVFCAITTLTRLDKECLQARLAVGCSECLKVQSSKYRCQVALAATHNIHGCMTPLPT